MRTQDLTGVRWIKSSFSGYNGEYVEFVALDYGHVALCNSNRPQGGVILFTRSEIAVWLKGVKHCEFDHLG